MKNAKDNLILSMEKLTGEMEKMNSFSRRFFLGIVFGVGSAIGASIIAATIVTALINLIPPLQDAPFLRK
ncbi:MAG: hypothetical protein ACD_15C00151G0020 [uncultured bacterium]|nr:MAG: hypothetical protein ACD_15C00151G0020 [uncultured bacterium]